MIEPEPTDWLDPMAAAFRLVARGWSVFPVAACGKTPATAHWPTDATTDPQQIAAWFAGAARPNIGIACGPSGLLVIDEDRPGALETFAAARGEALPATFTVVTGRGRHLYFEAPTEVVVGNGLGRAGGNGFDVRGSGGYVVAPGSVHASGVPYQPIDAGVPVAPLPDWLLEELHGIPDDKPLPIAEGTGRLSPRGRQLLLHGDQAGTFVTAAGQPTRSNLGQAIAVSAVRAGWTTDQFAMAMLDPENRGGLKWQLMARSKAVPDLHRKFEAAYRWALANPPGDPALRATMEMALKRMAHYPWPNPKTQNSDRRVMFALIQLAEELGTVEVHPGCRTLGQRAGLTDGTALCALARLVSYGLIERVFGPRSSDAADCYRILPKCWLFDARVETILSGPRVSNTPRLVREAFHRKALGSGPQAVYEAGLEAGWLTVKQLAAQTHKTPATVRDALHRLQAAPVPGAVRNRPNGRLWRIVPYSDEDLHQIATAYGTAGADRRAAARRQRERNAYADRLDCGTAAIGHAVRSPAATLP
jgi:hypothetical protein